MLYYTVLCVGGALSSAQLAALELKVQEAIKAELPVHTKLVSLSDAYEIFSLRAIFGENYPGVFV